MQSMFLSIEEDKPLAVWWATDCSYGAKDLNDFLEESKIDMSAEQSKRYAERLQIFVDELNAYCAEQEELV